MIRRLPLIFLAAYFVFVGGSPYYFNSFPIRVAHHVIVTLVFGGWLLNRLRRGQGLPRTPLDYVLYAAVGVWGITAVFSLDPRIAFESLWFPLQHVLMFFILANLIQRGRQRLVMEIQFMLAALVVIIAGMQLGSWYFGWGIVPGTDIGWVDVIDAGVLFPLNSPKLYLPFGVTTWLSAYVAPLILLAGAWALTARRKDERVVLWGLAVGLLIVLFGTGSRGGLIALGAAGVFLVGFQIIKNAQVRDLLRRYWWAVIGIGVVGAVVLALVISRIGIDPARIAGDRLRLDLWTSGLQIFRDDPLSGVGVGNFGRGLRAYRDPLTVDDRLGTAHNILLNTAAETGLTGIAALIGIAVLVVLSWWRLWSYSESTERKLRLEAALAGLIGISAQSLFDTFTMSSVVSIVLLLVAYCVTEPGSRLDTPATRRLPAYVALALLAGFALAFVNWDRAQSAFSRSVRNNDLTEAQTAQSLDPGLRLYALQIAYLHGNQAADSGDPVLLSEAIRSFDEALLLEPAWDTGWINRAALLEMMGDVGGARESLDQVWAINGRRADALYHAGRFAELQGDIDSAIRFYYSAMVNAPYLPLAAAWGGSLARESAIDQYVGDENIALSWRYRVAEVHRPVNVLAYVPENPVTADEWWVAGSYVATMEGNRSRSAEYFQTATYLEPTNGDWWAAWAWTVPSVPEPGLRLLYLDMAVLLGTTHEYPNALNAQLTMDGGEQNAYRAAAVPPRVIDQNFEGVLYLGRTASFEPMLRLPGRGTSAYKPLYDLAAEYLAHGETERAANVYRAILDAAPDETQARAYLEALP